jgi:centrosomal protein CEP104
MLCVLAPRHPVLAASLSQHALSRYLTFLHAARADAEEALHEAELRQREAVLGPNHPQLADSLSNMAILYSQGGNHAKALPLYKRALRIYEAAYGPDDPNVAHTLTDIAVLHLEQVGGRGQDLHDLSLVHIAEHGDGPLRP